MRFKLTLLPEGRNTTIPFNYQYALSAVIYNKIANASEEYAHFLHQKGYALNDYSKHFKFFTFSGFEGKFFPAKRDGFTKARSRHFGFAARCQI